MGPGISISFSIAIMAFGGFTPFINTHLVELTGNLVAPAQKAPWRSMKPF